MRKIVFLLLVSCAWLTGSGAAQAAQKPAPATPWPSVSKQLAGERVPSGSALEKLILENQDFSKLRHEEAFDKIRIPYWLRVHWRKHHPEFVYSSTDPTGGYPFVLKEVYEWMQAHPDLKTGPREPDLLPGQKVATVGTNVRVSGAQPNPRSESDIRINFLNPNLVIAASNNIGGSGMQGQYFSSDGGVTWGQTTLPLFTGDSFHSDPTVDWTSDGTAWSTTIGINSTGTQLRMRAYKSINNGATWTFDATFSGSQTSADKQLKWVDHSATSPFKDNIYVCWHNGTPQFVNRRTGPTGSWQTPLQISGAESTGTAIGCDVKTNANGDVFVYWPTTGNRRIIVRKSTTGGVSWNPAVIVTTTFDAFDIGIPAMNNRRALIYTSGGAYRTATKDNVYVVWTDLTGATGCTSAANEPGSNVSSTCKTRIWFSRSTNGGTSWSTPVMINNQSSLNDQFNQALAVDESTGRVAIIYYDTVADSGRRKTHVYYQSSSDDGVTWSAPVQVTTAQTDESVSGADLGNQYGDYNSLSGWADKFLPSWTDRRNNAREEIWTAPITDSSAPCVPPSAPTGVSATAAGQNQINLSWSAVAGAIDYRILRSTTSGGPYTQVGATTSTSFSDTGLTCNTTYFYVIRAFNGCESVNSAQVSATTAACPVCTTQTLYSNNFDAASGLSNWTRGTFVAGGATTNWRGVQTCTAHTGSRIFRYGGNNCTANYGNGNFIFAQPNGAGGVAVPAGATTTRLSFWHRRQFETGFDGGTLTVSVNGANYFFVPSTAIVSGATYNGTVAASCPPAGAAGAPIFTGTQTTFVNTVVDLDAMCNAATGGTGGCGGQAVRVGFTAISDCSVNADGWFLDTVTFTACVP